MKLKRAIFLLILLSLVLTGCRLKIVSKQSRCTHANMETWLAGMEERISDWQASETALGVDSNATSRQYWSTLVYRYAELNRGARKSNPPLCLFRLTKFEIEMRQAEINSLNFRIYTSPEERLVWDRYKDVTYKEYIKHLSEIWFLKYIAFMHERDQMYKLLGVTP